MNGQLSEHPLAELISEISAKGLLGVLRVARQRVKAAMYFEAGELTYATSNLRGYRLAEYLQKRGVVSAAQIAAAKDSRSDFALASALLSNGVLTRYALDETLDEQVADVLRLLLLWTDGEWSFDNRVRLSDTTRVRVATRQLLIESARRMDLKFAASRFRSLREAISPAGVAPNDFSLSPTEGFLLSRVEGPVRVHELAALSGLREPDALRTIYGLVLAGFLQREFWPHAFRAEATMGAAKAETVSVVNKKPATEASLPMPDAKQELDELLDRLSRATSHYEVLNVSSSAGVGEIRHAYHALARRYHPDRFHELAGTPLHARLESAFARVTQANEILINDDLRAPYDGKLAALKRVRDSTHSAIPWDARESQTPSVGRTENAQGGESDAQMAEKRFQEGFEALQLGQINAAISSLSAAARLAPDQPKFRAYYGRALASHEKTRRLAEGELQAAIKLDAGNASYHVMLATLYRDLGFYHRAVAELDRALALDPENTEARQMLRTLE